ncbi:G-protein-coupled receptor family 3 protein 3 [Tieghemostelium lacteum]|uniref:G-protein-coupled receptor family 3 protein 3 n=1 Tax=Tieghemostelium lacteum TaxID=361077 RepID=A0A152A9F2_TIELA|nr:G-protein-coupled receptor family 3 protein 3 [Tieghemostelium lacteum]|eukprot:KYR02853.1 G-protein-coupled receptor family 3 protein 3 [Tieghemostelium lacteum]
MKFNIVLLVVLVYLIVVIKGQLTGPRIGILTTGNPSDLGFNYLINQAKVNVEKEFKLKEIYYYPNVKPKQAYDFMLDLCKNKYTLIFAAAYDYVNDGERLAKQYPMIQFMLRGQDYAYDNVQYMDYNFESAQYMIGYFAGLMTKTGRLGFVQPGIPYVGNYESNSFFVGVKDANPDAQLYVYDTGSFDDIELSVGAAESLMDDYGVDIIGQNQFDSSVTTAVLNRGFIGMGINGFNQKSILGNKIAFNFVMDWTECFREMINKTIEHPLGDFQHANYLGDWTYLKNSRFMVYTYGRDVTEHAIEGMKSAEQYMSTVPKSRAPYFCYKNNQYLFSESFMTVSNCVPQGVFEGQNDSFPDMFALGQYKVPLQLRDVPRSFTVAISVVCGILLFFSILLEAVVYFNRNRAVIRSASPIFCFLIILGGIIVYVGIILWSVPPTTATCNGRYWLVTLGFTILIGSLVVKNFRIWLIFDNPELKTITITNLQLFPWITSLIFINTLLMAIITTVGGLQQISVQGIDKLSKNEYLQKCIMNDKGDIALYILLAYFGLLLIIGVFVSWKIRIVDIAEFNESKPIANTLYAISFSLFVIVSLVVSPQSEQDKNMILCIAGVFMTTAALGIIFVPKVFTLITKSGSKGNQFNFKKRSTIAHSRHTKNSQESQGSYSGHVLADFTEDESELSEKNQNSKEVEEEEKKVTNNYYDSSAPRKHVIVLAEFTDDSISDVNSEVGDQNTLDNSP